MKLTTKGRYAVMAMADLALFKDKGPTSLTDISLRQNISLAYLEQIFIKLKNKNLVKADDSVIITAGVPFGNAGSTNLLRIAKIIEDKKLT